MPTGECRKTGLVFRMKRQVLIVGAGPAGMAAALAAAEAGADVALLERRPKPGKKLLATGNGRCNLAHRGEPVYFGDPAFAGSVMAQFSPDVLSRRFADWGLLLYTDPEGRVYPATQQASTVVSVLTARLRAAGVKLETGADAAEAAYLQDRYIIVTADGRRYAGDRLVLATGGLAGGALGNRREDYALSEHFGHRITSLSAGLVPLECALGRLKKLSGLRVPARVTLLDSAKMIARTAGEVLFTDYGLSGICVMQLARDAQALLSAGRKPELRLDLSPVWFTETRAYCRDPEPVPDAKQKTLALLRERERRFGRKDLLTGLLPDTLIGVCPAGSPEQLAGFLTALPLEVIGVRPFNQAQITCGGIDTAQVDPATLGSRVSPGLFLAGELLNVDGDCGGYNLQFAFATGLIAGRNAALQ